MPPWRTRALICGAAGLLKGRRAMTHWAAFHLLPFFGAIPVNERVVVDGNMVFAAGAAGIDGALRLAAKLRGDEVVMEDEDVLGWVKRQATGARLKQSSCAALGCTSCGISI
jgi:transcriptional regulator GlxA family with amidase domain